MTWRRSISAWDGISIGLRRDADDYQLMLDHHSAQLVKMGSECAAPRGAIAYFKRRATPVFASQRLCLAAGKAFVLRLISLLSPP